MDARHQFAYKNPGAVNYVVHAHGSTPARLENVPLNDPATTIVWPNCPSRDMISLTTPLWYERMVRRGRRDGVSKIVMQGDTYPNLVIGVRNDINLPYNGRPVHNGLYSPDGEGVLLEDWKNGLPSAPGRNEYALRDVVAAAQAYHNRTAAPGTPMVLWIGSCSIDIGRPLEQGTGIVFSPTSVPNGSASVRALHGWPDHNQGMEYIRNSINDFVVSLIGAGTADVAARQRLFDDWRRNEPQRQMAAIQAARRSAGLAELSPEDILRPLNGLPPIYVPPLPDRRPPADDADVDMDVGEDEGQLPPPRVQFFPDWVNQFNQMVQLPPGGQPMRRVVEPWGWNMNYEFLRLGLPVADATGRIHGRHSQTILEAISASRMRAQAAAARGGRRRRATYRRQATRSR